MFHSSKQNNISVSDRVFPCEHLMSLIRGNTRAFSSCHDTLFSIVTYYVNVYALSRIVKFHNTCTILCIFYLVWYHNLFNSSLNQIILGYRSQRSSLHSSSCTRGPTVLPLHLLSLAPPHNPFSSGRTCGPSLCP